MTVTCVLLTADRPALTARAIRCFLAQTYADKRLLILDNGKAHLDGKELIRMIPPGASRKSMYFPLEHGAHTFGELRNLANDAVGSELIAHWDSDDLSHPRRLEEQVALLESTGADLVGYNDMLFWDSRCAAFFNVDGDERYEPVDELWLYKGGHNFALDTSRLYRRSLWESNPYPVGGCGVDNTWLYRVPVEKRACVSSICDEGLTGSTPVPRMIAHIHGGNMQQEHKWMTTKQGQRITDPALVEMVRERMRL